MKRIFLLTSFTLLLLSAVAFASPDETIVVESNSIIGIEDIETYSGPTPFTPPDSGSIAGMHDRDIIPLRRGCCSHHRGVCGCDGGRQVCCDGSYSPTCRC